MNIHLTADYIGPWEGNASAEVVISVENRPILRRACDIAAPSYDSLSREVAEQRVIMKVLEGIGWSLGTALSWADASLHAD